MRDAERDLSQDDTSVEITALPTEDELPEEQNFPTGMAGEDGGQANKANRSRTRRFLLLALTVCMAIVLLLVTIVIPRSQSPMPSTHRSSLAASPMLTSTSIPYVPTDYRVSTTIVNGVVYAGAANGGVYALNASNGNLFWHHKIDPGADTAPLVSDGTVYIVANISDGAVLWHYSLSKENGNNLANWLSIEDGTVYIGTYVDQDKSYIFALRSDNGSLLWRQAMHKGMPVNASVASAVIYNASFISDGSANAGSGAVYALRGSDGSQLWFHSMYWVVYNPPELVGSTLYVSTAGGDVFAYQASNGSLLWHFHTDVS